MLAFLLILYQINIISTEQPPWDRWMLDNSPEPRRHGVWKPENKPYEAPNFYCKCPPNDECKLDFEIDDKALDFLKLRGLLKKREEAQLKNHMSLVKNKSLSNLMHNRISRRSNGPTTREPCCCPPSVTRVGL